MGSGPRANAEQVFRVVEKLALRAVNGRSPLDAALFYASIGWRVFPVWECREDGACSCSAKVCKDPGKHPRISDWTGEASVEPTTLRRWWKRWPAANLAVATGAGSNLYVVEGDGQSGADELRELLRTHPHEGPFCSARSGGGGLHSFWKYPAAGRYGNTAKKLAAHVDTRGEGGYLLLAPSNHKSGRRYEWLDDALPGELPAGILAALEAPKDRGAKRAPKIAQRTAQAAEKTAQTPVARYAERALTSELERVRQVPIGQRNAELNKGAFRVGQLLHLGLERADASAQLLAAALTMGLNEQEASATIASGLDAGALQPRTPARLAQLQPPAPEKNPTTPIPWREAPDAEALRAPEGYVLDAGVSSVGPDGKTSEVSVWPLYLSERTYDVETHELGLRAVWRMGRGVWVNEVVPRGVAFQSAKVVEALASKGAPLTSGTAKAVVRYLHAFEAANIEVLKTRRVTRSLGWVGQASASGFLLGRTWYPCATASDNAPVDFLPGDAGDAQLADAFECAGTLAEWQELITPVAQHPRAQMALYASLAAPLLSRLGVSGFVVDWSGRTSIGKTTSLTLAASVWGRPEQLLLTWDATRVGVERRMALLRGLPVFLDDTKRAKKPQDIASTIYGAANGRGRERGSLKGTAATATWRTAVLTTGEQKITEYTKDGGTRARTLCLEGSPFEGTAGPLVARLHRGLRRCFGTAGHAWIRLLCASELDWATLERAHEAAATRYAALAEDGTGQRLADYLAALEVAGILAHEAGVLPGAWGGLADAEELLAHAGEAAPEVRAWPELGAWLAARREQFATESRTADHLTSSGILGKWDKKLIYVFPPQLDRALKELGYEPNAVISAAASRGWLVKGAGLDGKKRTQTRISIVGVGQVRVYALQKLQLDLDGDC